ncbi:hypothetical protein MBEHAL_0755 [Halarchaeum acidiphilum MH1-52-1]|uniref:Uncharacterized protein n=1 Tax=Halarchaeum acidiphilum MH1-52-1 TaxID=1261545 RepID=U2YSL3_9EURY|nr:hypothetical protein [Halarchaeum acidiphilum]GAD51995.1 hypothetical protein MBEHAL_0755 [Halarchaeum acidiphilum MH1-52-1]
MRRRQYLAAGTTGLAGALAGCTGFDPFGPSGEWKLRAMPADPNASDYTCTLNDSFVSAHPHLKTVLSRARDGERGTWSDPVYLDAKTGNDLGTDLSEHCQGGFRGVYFYDGDAFFVSLIDRHPGNGKGHDH